MVSVTFGDLAGLVAGDQHAEILLHPFVGQPGSGRVVGAVEAPRKPSSSAALALDTVATINLCFLHNPYELVQKYT